MPRYVRSTKPPDPDGLARCRAKLVEHAKAGGRITYGELAAVIGVNHRNGLGLYLDAIYAEDRAAGRPDLTLLAVYAGTQYGRFNSAGGPAGSRVIRPVDPGQTAEYDAAVGAVVAYWRATG